MKKKKWKKEKAAAILLTGSLFIMSISNGITAFKTRESLANDLKNEKDFTGIIEDINQHLENHNSLKEQFLKGYGYLQNMLFKHEFLNFKYVIDKAGYLHSGNFYNGFGDDQKKLAIQMRLLKDYAQQFDTKVSIALSPMKIALPQNQYLGIPYNHFYKEADEFIRGLRYYGVPYIDLKESLQKSSLTYDDIFYKTDSRWKTRAAFQGYTHLLTWFENNYHVTLDKNFKTRDIKHYQSKIYPQFMFGNQGKEVGKGIVKDMEDFEMLYPLEGGDYVVSYGSSQNLSTKEGSINEIVLNSQLETLVKDKTQDDCYDKAFLHESSDYIRIINKQNLSAPSILVIRDSYASPLCSYMAQNFSQLDAVSLYGKEKDNILKMIKDNHYDYVLVSLYPETLSQNHLQLFDEVDYE